ncbi:MAG: HAMP domain-containing histidine kinase [Chloroflexi bacterium]|nr:HAMP domain-containing histidine kinase [Chloroflexota bacterium]
MMWQRLCGGPWPDTDNLLPEAAQRQAAEEIRRYWRLWGWQLVLGEIVLWAATVAQGVPQTPIYGLLALLIAAAYGLGLLPRLTPLWLAGSVIPFLIQGMAISGLGPVTALSFLMQYTFAGMLLTGRRRVFVQAICMGAFWISLIYEVSGFPELSPPGYIAVGYNILLAVFTFQTMRFLYHLAVDLNTTYVEARVRQQSQQFLARVSHELRTPLNSVLGFAKLLHRAESAALSATHQAYLQQIIDESEHLNRLVSDLLDSAHLSTGKLTLQRERCDINAICEAVAAEHRPALASGVELHLQLAPDLPHLLADRLRLRQALGNLVSNAVKYTTQGTVTLSTACQGQQIVIEVSDTGIGIAEAEQKLIFVPFVQLDSRRVGVGLGLDIARQLIRLHGGDIHLQSTLGQGSTFTIELPLTQ